jgi:hypothetical protein
MSGVVELKERVVKDDYALKVYDIVVGDDSLFAYLYVTPETYSLVWMADEDFRFTGKYTCDFIETQFSNLGPGEIKTLLSEDVPIHRSAKVTPRKPFSYGKSVVTLMFADEGEDGDGDDDFEQYNFFEERDEDRYRKRVNSDAISRLLLARFDFEIVTYKGEGTGSLMPSAKYDCCFTFENRQGAPVRGWELAVNLPKGLDLKDRTLRWIARNHRDRDFWRRLDFEKSLAALQTTLNR